MAGVSTGRAAGAWERVPRAQLDVPRLPPGHVRRPRLLALLDAATDGRLVLVSAPAGYGKSVLLADWAAGERHRTAWVSLSADDDDDRRLWSGLVAALSACPAVPDDSPIHTLHLPGSPGADPDFLAEITDALAGLPEPVTLVLDDVHELTGVAALHGLAALVRDRPVGLRIVLSGRADPPLQLARMRVAGELCEVRADDLRFTADEAEAMLDASGTPLDPPRLALLVEQTEGWAAGLRLAGPSMQGVDDPDRFLRDMVGTGRAVSDYLVGEVLDGLDGDLRDLLHAISVCERVSAPLAAAMSGRAEAGELLERLERGTALVVSSGAGRIWYRLHPLLRAHLQVDLRRRRPDLAAELHRRAADWFVGQHLPAAALRHARHAGDVPALVEILHADGPLLFATGEHRALREVLGSLDADVLADPWLAVLAALAHLEVGELTEADRYLALVAGSDPAGLGPEPAALYSLAVARRASLTGDTAAAGPASPGLGSDVEEELGLTPLALLDRAQAALLSGCSDAARELAEAARDRARADGNAYLEAQCTALLAAVAGLDGDFGRMTTLAERADAAVPVADWRRTGGAAYTATLRAYGALLQARPADCLRLAEPSTAFVAALGPDAPPRMTALVDALRGAALVDVGDHAAGIAALEAARVAATAEPVSPEQSALIAVLEYRAAAALGLADRARPALALATSVAAGKGDVLVLRARGQLRLGRTASASSLLAPVLDGTAPLLVPWVLAEAWLLACRVALRTGSRAQARRALDNAVSASAALDVLLPLVFADADVVEFQTRDGGGRSDGFARRVQQARRALGGERLPVALTERERAVLRLLMTLRSVEEIAADLTVSTNTVKTHLRAIYGKLGVGNRRDAVAAARRRGLADPPAG